MMLTWPSVLPAAQTASTPPMSAADVASFAATAADGCSRRAAADGAAADGAAALGAAALAGAEDAPLLEHAANSSAVTPSRAAKRVFLFCTSRLLKRRTCVPLDHGRREAPRRASSTGDNQVGAGSSPFTSQACGRFPGLERQR